MKHLIQFLIASLVFVFSSGCSASSEKDDFTYQGSKNDLHRLFELDERFLSDGLITLRFNRQGITLKDINQKQCLISVYMRYLVDDVGYALSSKSYFNDQDGFTFEIIDKKLRYSGSIYLSFNIEKGGCVLDDEYSYSKSYFFKKGILLKKTIRTDADKRSIRISGP
ncbi:hypothetical protein [Oceanicoccus sagamiensis]|uniref:Lipoprotein n=1 Tax=Oceanicoccus sagamiensis TaxID=716816 RepID=A0A1X9N370_9GAMM|nr:hypothetical protein [Oceanicoccus sagamiensis]ARN72660.1 hypothetical protein BST96_00135 [Oceanicoccus sagamiensis]